MNDNNGLSAGDILALTKNNGMDFMGGAGFWWVIVFLIVAGMFNGNGFGFGNNNVMEDEFIKRDIFSTNQNVSNTACQTQRDVLDAKYGLGQDIAASQYSLGTEIQNNRFNCSQNACNTQKEIIQSRYDNSLQMNNLQAQMAQCCCDLKTAIHSEGETTRALITENTIQELRDRLSNANNAITSQTLANNIVGAVRPYPVPAYPVSSPYGTSYPYGCYGVANVI